VAVPAGADLGAAQVTRDELVKKARHAMEEARKKLTGNAGAENLYADARTKLEALNELRPLRRKYR
jgi:hypothetical protein